MTENEGERDLKKGTLIVLSFYIINRHVVYYPTKVDELLYVCIKKPLRNRE